MSYVCQEEFLGRLDISVYADEVDPLSGAIERLFRETGMSQKAVAHRAELDPESVNRVVRGRTPDPRWSTMVALLRDGFRVSLDAFVGGAATSPLTAYDRRPEYRDLVSRLEAIESDAEREWMVETFMRLAALTRTAASTARPAPEDNVLEFVPARREVIPEHKDFHFPVPPDRFQEGDFDYPRDWHYWRGEEVSTDLAAGPHGVVSDGEAHILNPSNPTEVFDRLQKIVRVKGDSMSPRYLNGDLLRVDTTSRTPRDGEPVAVYITELDNEGGIIGTLRRDGERVSLEKRNPLYAAVDLPSRGWVLIGVVAEIVSRTERAAERLTPVATIAREATAIFEQMPVDDAAAAMNVLRSFAKAKQITSRGLREDAHAPATEQTDTVINESNDQDRGDSRPTRNDQRGRARRPPVRRDPNQRSR